MFETLSIQLMPAQRLIALRPLCENVIDFELLPSAILEKSGSPGCLLEALLRPSDSGDHLRLLVYKYPAMEVLLDKLVPMHTSLARSRHTSEHIYFTSVGTTEYVVIYVCRLACLG